jgi:phage baseplate assembly protein W
VSTAQTNPQAFLGSGIVRPFRRDQKSDFANDAGAPVIRACVGQILGTQCSDEALTQGEIPWRPAFGSKLFRLRHRKGPMLQELARHYVTEALQRWEPRVTNVRVQSAFFRTSRVLSIHLVYDVIDKNVAGNNVILANVEQTIDLPLAA